MTASNYLHAANGRWAEVHEAQLFEFKKKLIRCRYFAPEGKGRFSFSKKKKNSVHTSSVHCVA